MITSGGDDSGIVILKAFGSLVQDFVNQAVHRLGFSRQVSML